MAPSPAETSDVAPIHHGWRRRLPAWLRRLSRGADRDGGLLLSVILIVGLALAVAFGAIRAAEYRLLEARATRTAVHWGQFLQTRLQGLDEILVAGLVSAEDQRTLDFAGAAGSVRDYQVIRPDGVVALSSWSGDFRGALDIDTVMSVIEDKHIIADVIERTLGGQRTVIGQAFVPLVSATGQRGALKVNVDMTREAANYRDLGNGAFALLLALLLPPAMACGWLVQGNIRGRRYRERLERERRQVLELLATGADLDDVLRRIANFAEQHHRHGCCIILTLDADGRRIEKSIAPFGDLAAARLVGQPLEDVSPLVRSGLLPDTAAVRQGPRGVVWSAPLRASSGTILGGIALAFDDMRWAEAAARGSAPALAQLAGLAIERRRAEEALADMRQRHEAILNAAGDGIVGIDGEARIIFANPAAARLLRREAAAMIGADAIELIEGSPREDGYLEGPIAATLRDCRSRQVEQRRLWRGDGSAFVTDLVVSPVRRAGASLSAVVVFHDISTQIEAQRQLRRAKEEAEGANRAKSSFLAHMSHELRTPLNAVIGFSEVMAQQILGPIGNPRYREYAEHIHGSGAHLLALINDLLDLSKIEAGKLELVEEAVDLGELLHRCTVFISEKVHSSRLRLAVEITPDLSTVHCDPLKMKQVVINLLSNAVKFTGPGGEIRVEAWRRAGDELCIAVIDTGIGIAVADLEKVMQPFGQADEALNRSHQGTGLGLPLAKALVELHGGSLTLESRPGSGTTVTIRLPGRALPPDQAAAVA